MTIDFNFIPETLTWCANHYVPPIKDYIMCKDFGRCDGTSDHCYQCMELTPYQFEMCSDETWLLGLIPPSPRSSYNTREEAAEFINHYKQKFPQKDIVETLYELHKGDNKNEHDNLWI